MGRFAVALVAASLVASALAAFTLARGDAGAATSASVNPAGDPAIAVAGDIACDPKDSNFNNGNGGTDTCRMKATSDLVVGHGYAAALPLGDNQYYCGGLAAWQQSYDPTWGRVKSISHPAVGNHEYITSTSSSAATGCNNSNAGAAGYFTYWGSRAGAKGSGYYSYNIGSWHLIALNTNCGDAGGCSPSSPQGKWLAADLAKNQQPCTLAYMHIPLFSSGGRANNNSKTFWDQLYAAHADVVLTAHDHTYERFAQQTPSGAASSAGLREFVVGTGGANHTSLASKAANSQVFNQDTFGILAMNLLPTSYKWNFVHVPGKTFTDSGTTACHKAGYWMVTANGTVYPFGQVKNWGNVATRSPVTHFEPTPGKFGYWIVNAAGQVFAFGDANWYGNAGTLQPGEIVSSLSRTAAGKGYWLFTTHGRVLPRGDARSHGDLSRLRLNGPIVGSIATPSGNGYYMVGADGGIFCFGDAVFRGSMGGKHLNRPVESVVPTADNRGYWLVASDGGIFAFGNAPFRGSMGGTPLAKPVVGMVRYGNGYLMVSSDGGVFNFSNLAFLGSLGANPPPSPVVSIAA